VGKFEDLEVWKRSARLSADLFKMLYSIKDYGFRDQVTRAGLSIPSNIAEGYERLSNKEKSNFLNQYSDINPQELPATALDTRGALPDCPGRVYRA